MADYPNSEEEFELMYGDELQMINEQEDEELEAHIAGPSSRRSLNFGTPRNKPKSQREEPKSCSSKQTDPLETSFDRDFNKLDSDPNTKKRGIVDLFGDIDDLLQEEERNNISKKPKTDLDKREADEQLIQRILELRKQNAAKQNPSLSVVGKAVSSFEHIKNNVSAHVPRYPFIGVTREDGERIYVRMHDEEYEKENIKEICANNSYKGLLGSQSSSLWKEANEIINKKLESAAPVENSVNETNNSKLWVDLYKPRKYIELLSDESTNRTLLSWLILWDKVVFQRWPKIINRKQQNSIQSKNFFKKELDLKLDESDRPLYKVALLCGPPGLGKTTLAHLVAKHWGYNVVEVNASDDRNVESFKKALEDATQMRSCVDQEKRPNCLIFDEIDGAPSGAIDYLIKFINGTAGKKGKNKKKQILKRPVICICNDVYVPALRPLRQIALILNFPPTSSSRLAERLFEISRYQHIKTDRGAMLALAQKTNNDIRSCLTVLNFFKSLNKPVTLSEIQKTQIGQKDMQKGLFNVWSDIFEVKLVRDQNRDSNTSRRMKDILETVITFGDYERLTRGVFENYPNMKLKGAPLEPICDALEWFGFTDLLNKKIHETQNYTMNTYLPYGFVVWHFAFSSNEKKKIAYPSVGYEVTTKLNCQNAIITEIFRGMPPALRVYVSAESLRLDVIPMLANILVPNLRTINVSLYAPQERVQLAHVVDIMIDYNLTYVQERNAEGIYNFTVDPNIDEVSTYNGLQTNRRTMSYANRQMLAKEIEIEKMRRLEKSLHKNSGLEKLNKDQENIPPKKIIPNHLQRLNAKKITPKEVVDPEIVKREFNKFLPVPLPLRDYFPTNPINRQLERERQAQVAKLCRMSPPELFSPPVRGTTEDGLKFMKELQNLMGSTDPFSPSYSPDPDYWEQQ